MIQFFRNLFQKKKSSDKEVLNIMDKRHQEGAYGIDLSEILEKFVIIQTDGFKNSPFYTPAKMKHFSRTMEEAKNFVADRINDGRFTTPSQVIEGFKSKFNEIADKLMARNK